MTENVKTALNDKAWARWTALALLALGMFCSYIFMDLLSPIKNLVQETRGWDSLAFGTMQGSETFLNVFIFFLIFAGIILDKMGVRFTAILSGVVMLVGATINCMRSPIRSVTLPTRCISGSTITLIIYRYSTNSAYRLSMKACPHRPSSRPSVS